MTFFYCGNLTAARSLFDGYPINTDDKPLIEYVTPKMFRKLARENPIIWFVGPELTELTERIFERCPPSEDPILAQRSAANRRLVAAGLAFHRAMIWKSLDQVEVSQEAWRIFKREWLLGAD